MKSCRRLSMVVLLASIPHVALAEDQEWSDTGGSLSPDTVRRLKALVQGLATDDERARDALAGFCTDGGDEVTLAALYLTRHLPSDARAATWNALPSGRFVPLLLAFESARLAPTGDLAYARVAFRELMTDRVREVVDAIGSSSDQQELNPLWTCFLSYWRFVRGEIALSLAHLCNAERIDATRRYRPLRCNTAFPGFIREDLASALEQRAVLAASKGEARTDLLKRWEIIAAVRGDVASDRGDGVVVTVWDLPTTLREWRDAVPDWPDPALMIELLRGQVAEEAAWEEPTPAALAASDATARARHYVHRLLDSAVSRHAVGSHCPSSIAWGPETDPAVKLLEIGWEALPVVIEILEDPRPTRGYRSYNDLSCLRMSRTPFRYGSFSREFVDEVAGMSFRSRADAEAWWKEAKSLGPVGHFRGMLRRGYGRGACFAARRLMARDPDAYVDEVLAEAGRRQDAAASSLLWVAAEGLRARHMPVLLPMLDSPCRLVVLASACLLATRCASDAGTDALLGLLRTPPTGEEYAGERYPLSVMEALAAIGSPRCVDAVCAALAGSDPDHRRAALAAAPSMAHARVLDSLVSLLDHTDPTNGDAIGLPDQLRDVAASAICTMLGRDSGRARAPTRAERDQHLAELRAWLATNRDSLDWPAMRARRRR